MGGATDNGSAASAASGDIRSLAGADDTTELCGAVPKEPHKMHGAGCDRCVVSALDVPMYSVLSSILCVCVCVCVCVISRSVCSRVAAHPVLSCFVLNRILCVRVCVCVCVCVCHPHMRTCLSSAL